MFKGLAVFAILALIASAYPGEKRPSFMDTKTSLAQVLTLINPPTTDFA